MRTLSLVVSVLSVSLLLGNGIEVNGDFETGDGLGWTEWNSPWGGPFTYDYLWGDDPFDGSYSLHMYASAGSFGVYQEFWSTATIDKYTLSGIDASIGWALTPQQVGPRRLSPHTPVKNLYLSGHWTRPALGVLATVISGLQTAKTVLNKAGISEPLADLGITRGVMA